MLRTLAYALWASIPFVVYLVIIRQRLHVGFLETYLYEQEFWPRWKARLKAFRTLIIGGAGLLVGLLAELGAFAYVLPIPEKYQSIIILVSTIASLLISRGLVTTPEGVPIDEPMVPYTDADGALE